MILALISNFFGLRASASEQPASTSTKNVIKVFFIAAVIIGKERAFVQGCLQAYLEWLPALRLILRKIIVIFII